MRRISEWSDRLMKLSIKTKIIFAVSALVVVFMATVSYVTLSYYEKHFKSVIAEHHYALLSVIANETDDKLTTAHQQLIANAKLVPPQALSDPDKAQRFLDNSAGLHSIFDNHLFLFTPSGILIAESPFLPDRRGIDLSYRPYIKHTVEKKEPYISDPYISTQKHKHPVIMMTAPIFDKKGALVAILTGSLDLMRGNILGKLAEMKVGKTGYVYLTAADRTMIVHPDKSRIFKQTPVNGNTLYDRAIQGFEGTDETIDTYGAPMLSTFKRFKVNNWILAADYPMKEAHARILKLERYFLLAATAGSIALFFIIFSLIKHFTNPLIAFTRHIEALQKKQGHDKLISISARNEIGTLSRAFNQMVLELDQQQEALLKSEERYRTIFDSANDAIFIVDLDTAVILDVNHKMNDLFGYAREEAQQLDIGVLSAGEPPYARADALEWIRKAAEAPQLFEWKTQDKGGRLFWIEINMRRAHIGGTDRLLVVARDITERKRAEEERERLEAQLMQAQKMEAVGQLAGGIAHDFNNILTAIIGYGSILYKKLSKDDPLWPNVEHILESAQRAAKLTHSLLAFSRKHILTPRLLDLNELIHRVEQLLRRIIGEDIELRLAQRDEQLFVIADSGHIEQVLMNLATNARDAMPQGGVLSISSERVVLDSDAATDLGCDEPGEYALITIIDTGVGMDEDTRKRIFEPFFTTKEVGKGTGLGLAMAYGIITQHKGAIDVRSESGRGTTFHIYLPISMRKPDTKWTKYTLRSSARGAETILVAEDDASLRMLSKTVLEESGYKVIEAVDGEDAVAKFVMNRDSINLLLFDVIMPKKNGREAYDEIKKIRPSIKALFLSGYTADMVLARGIEQEGMNFIKKPLAPWELLEKIRAALNRNAT